MGSACQKPIAVDPSAAVVPGGAAPGGAGGLGDEDAAPPEEGASTPEGSARALALWVSEMESRSDPRLPDWGKLKTAERIALVREDAELALEGLDAYWFYKVRKYVTGNTSSGKAPKLPCHGGEGGSGMSKRAERQWKLMLRAQKDCHRKRLLIWEETQLTWWKQLDDENRAEDDAEGKRAATVSSPPPRREGPAGMAALGAKGKSVGLSGKSSSSLSESQKTADSKKQVKALEFLSIVIARQR